MVLQRLTRLNKILADKGIASRREADRLIKEGMIKVNGKVALLGERFDPADVNIKVDSHALEAQARQKTVLLNKPLNIVSSQPEDDSYTPAVRLLTTDRQFFGRGENKRQKSFLDPRVHKGWAPAGRLDVNSTGLLVLTQSGRLARKLIGEDSRIEKEYLVRVRPTARFDRSQSTETVLQQIRNGIIHDGDMLRVESVERLDDSLLNVVLTEGKRHHLRRICQSLNFHVESLHRVRIGDVRLQNLPMGCWRYLTSNDSF